jgi:hypothetical protein
MFGFFGAPTMQMGGQTMVGSRMLTHTCHPRPGRTRP